MAGLKDLWGLGETQSTGQQDDARVAELKSQFQAAIGRVNKSLQFTAANAPPADHQPLAQRRDQAYVVFQRAMSESALQDQALRDVTSLQVEVDRLKSMTQQAKLRYETLLPNVENTQHLLVTADAGSSRDVAKIQQQLQQAEQFARERDYQAAIKGYKSAEIKANKLKQSTESTEVNEKKYPLQKPLDEDPRPPTDPRELKNWQNPLINGDPQELFTPERMDEVVGMHFKGQGDPELNEAMEGLLFPPQGQSPEERQQTIEKHKETIRRIRGLTKEQIDSQYERFEQLQGISKQLEKTKELDHDDTYDNNGADFKKKHPDFLGSRSNLRFGQVVGQATGLDPAFAGMLNPTGGMVGPGMNHLAPTDADSPVVWHGIFHDAGGYLLNHQNSGPGYTYLPDVKPESGRRGSDAIQGQVEGVSYWYEKANPGEPLVETFLKDMLAHDKQRTAYDAYIKQPVDDAEKFAKQLTQDGVDKVSEVAGDARDMNRKAASELKNATNKVASKVNSAVDAADSAVDSFADTAKGLGLDGETVDAAEQTIDEQLTAVRNQVAEWNQSISNGIDQASNLVDDSIDGIETWAGETGSAITGKITELADEARAEIHDQLVALGNNKELIDFARRAVDKIGETKQDAKRLKQEVAARIESAEAKVAQLYNDAKTAVNKKVEAGEAMMDEAAEKLDTARNYLTDKLAQVRDTAARGADAVGEQIGDVGDKLVETGQDIRDAAAGVVDGLSDAIDSGTDALANTVGSATDWAGEKLGRLTTLFG